MSKLPETILKCKLCECQEFGLLSKLNEPRREKPCLRGFANNTGADQPAHPRSLISAFLFAF